jgi:hypothetical protein
VISTLTLATEVLSRFRYDLQILDEATATFENETVLGFVLVFPTPGALLQTWKLRSDEAIQHKQFQLRAAGEKAWNTYIVLLAEEEAERGQIASLTLIEEDLLATRKIARAGVASERQAQSALLSLLPLQSAPVLESVDMEAEIRARGSDVSDAALRAFLSDADEALVLQVLGEIE